MTQEIVIKVVEGIVDPISIPENISLTVRDYDIPSLVNDKNLIQTDNDGKEFVEIVFDSSDTRPESET